MNPGRGPLGPPKDPPRRDNPTKQAAPDHTYRTTYKTSAGRRISARRKIVRSITNFGKLVWGRADSQRCSAHKADIVPSSEFGHHLCSAAKEAKHLCSAAKEAKGIPPVVMRKSGIYIPETVNSYTLLKKLGEGGYGFVCAHPLSRPVYCNPRRYTIVIDGSTHPHDISGTRASTSRRSSAWPSSC